MPLSNSFSQQFNTTPTVIARAPGRVNLLGEHVDYNDGFVLPVAIDRSVRVAAAPVPDGLVTLAALDLNERISFSLDRLGEKVDVNGDLLPTWARYPAGVAHVLRQEGLEVKGLQAAFTSDVPIGAGLSSSAAVEVAFAVTWRALGEWKRDALQIARLCQRAENQYVGVNCGLMDQFASACGMEGNALYFDTRSLDWQPVPLPPRTAVVIADSGVRRSLAASAYNERRASCEQAVAILNQHIPEVHSLRDVSAVEFAAYSELLPPTVRKRAEHVVKEIARVQDAVIALRRGDAQLFGGLMYSGHASLRDLYEVSCPELDALVDIAREQPGCYGARLTGAGFGGCTVNLVEEGKADAFIQNLKASYQTQTGRTAHVYLCKASAGATTGTRATKPLDFAD
jgi:galactokinase